MTSFLFEYRKRPTGAWEALPSLAGSERFLRYRAPDGVTTHTAGRVRALVGRRNLATRANFDLSPFVNPRSGVWTFLDGRLDGRADLIRLFRARGLGLREVVTDTELVSTTHEVFGDKFLDHLRGDFSLVVFDPVSAACTVARDPLGVRTVLFAETSGGWLFSNELPSLIAHPEVDHELSERAIADFLLFGYLDWHDKRATAFRAVQNIYPGECMELSGDGAVARRYYWQFPLDTEPTRLRPAEVPEAFRSVLDTALGDRIGGRRVLLFMSGGLDSTSLAALANRPRERSQQPVSLLARTAVSSSGSEEERVARAVAAKLGIRHDVVTYPRDEVLQPGYPTWGPGLSFIRRPTAEDLAAWPHVDCILHASSADNALMADNASFLGIARTYGISHAWHARQVLATRGASLPWGTGFGRLVGKRAKPNPISAPPSHGPPNWINRDLFERLHLRERWDIEYGAREPSAFHRTHPRLHYWFDWANWFQGTRMIGLSACPPDSVDPFLDLRVIEFVLSLPPKPWLDRKHLLREAMSGLLPDDARLRQKVPAGNFIAPMVNALPEELLNTWRAAPELRSFLDRSKVPIIDADAEGSSTYINLRPLMLNQWLVELKSWLPRSTD